MLTFFQESLCRFHLIASLIFYFKIIGSVGWMFKNNYGAKHECLIKLTFVRLLKTHPLAPASIGGCSGFKMQFDNKYISKKIDQ